MPVEIDLSGKVALVTGAGQGIGAAVARALHRAGATVVLNDVNARNAFALLAELNAARPGSAVTSCGDVGDPEAVGKMMENVRAAFGGLDVLVNNAGILRDRRIDAMTLDDWHAVLRVNLTGVFLTCKLGLGVMREGGCVVNVGSLSAEAGFPGQANYAAAKAGVAGLTRVLSRECAKRSIRVNAVAPGLVDTTILDPVPEAVRERMVSSIPLKRMARPEEVAGAVLFLCSPLASYITGHTLRVDGGWRG